MLLTSQQDYSTAVANTGGFGAAYSSCHSHVTTCEQIVNHRRDTQKLVVRIMYKLKKNSLNARRNINLVVARSDDINRDDAR